MFINITIRSKNKNSIIKFLKIFKETTKIKKLRLSRLFSFSNNDYVTNFFSILKSPHVNKTAQEQLVFNIFSKKLEINSFQKIKILIILKKIQTTFFSDISINIKYLKNKNINNYLFLNMLKLNNFKNFELYLKLFNIYGKYKFL